MFSWQELLVVFIVGCNMPMIWGELKRRFGPGPALPSQNGYPTRADAEAMYAPFLEGERIIDKARADGIPLGGLWRGPPLLSELHKGYRCRGAECEVCQYVLEVSEPAIRGNLPWE